MESDGMRENPAAAGDQGLDMDKAVGDDGRWETLSSEYLFRRPWLTVRHDKVRLPDGGECNRNYGRRGVCDGASVPPGAGKDLLRNPGGSNGKGRDS